jgi:ATP-binding cassette subfamily B protein
VRFRRGRPARPPGWLRQLVGALRPHRRSVVVALVAAGVGQTVAALTPLFERHILDQSIIAQSSPLAPWIALLVVAGVVRFVAAYLRRYWAGRVSLDVQNDLRTAVYDNLQRLDFARHDELQTGQLVSRASSDIGLIQGLLAFLPIVLANVLFFAIALVVMAILSPLLTLVALAMTPLLAVISVRLRSTVFPASWDAQQQAGVVAGVVEESVSGVRVVKGFGQEQRQVGRLAAAAERLFGSRVRAVRLTARYQPTLQAIPSIGQVAVLVLGGYLAIHGHITLGTFLAFSSYVTELQAPVRQLTGLMTIGQQARAGVERVFELLDSTPVVTERPNAPDLATVTGGIVFDDVSFGYLRSDPVLRNFSLRVEPGETIALVGTSGSGKSTIALLLPRFYDVQSGSISIDGTDVTTVTLDSLRQQVGEVFEDSFLFSDTVRSNIAFGRPDATDDEIRAAARAAEADRFIEGLPEGYDTVVGERGLTLSGGQRQRIALARAIITDPRILVLDDATSAIDSRVEHEILQTLRHIAATRTTILVAHRRSTLALADRICVVDEGRVVDVGTHDELEQRCQLFRALLSGPGEDAEAIDAGDAISGNGAGPSEFDDALGVTPALWRRDEDESDATDALRAAGRARLANPAGGAGLRVVSGGGGGGAVGGGGLAGAMAPTPELLAKVDALPDVRDETDMTIDDASRPDPTFRFMRFLRPWWGQLGIGFVLVALDSLATLAGPAILRHGIDQGVTPKVMSAVWVAAGVFVLVVTLDWMVTIAQTIVTGRAAERVLYALRIRVFSHLQRLSLDYYDRELGGRIMTRMTTDIEALTQLLQTGLVTALVSLLTCAGIGVVLVVMNWKLALITMSIVPPLVIATLWFRRSSSRAYEEARERVATVNADFQESLSGVRVSQAYVNEGRNSRRFAGLSQRYLDARLKAQKLVATYFPFVEMLSEIAAAIVLAAGARFVADGTLSTGELVAFLLYLDLFFSPIQQLSQVFDTYQQASVALDHVGELLSTPTRTPDAPEPVRPATMRGEIRFEDVHFAYPSAIDEALRGVDLTIEAGETVAIVGETGAGKSTVEKLVARYYDVTTGRVTVDGVDVRDYDLTAMRQHLGVVPQEPFLFAGTIRDNIAFGRPDATDAEVEAAARAVGAHEVVARQSGGYLHVVAERGQSLSSGQRQLLALARARLVDPAILLLDEATSNLDLATEAKVNAAMGVVSRGRTTLVIAHRLPTAATADRIVVMDGGRVVECGTHRELLASDGHYTDMWRSFEGEQAAA